jgi:hypothetical protein
MFSYLESLLQKRRIKDGTLHIVDFLNVFSDFREIKYKQKNIDFHAVKHTNKLQDTIEFFDLFFKRYIRYAKISSKTTFIFVMKRLNDYDILLQTILQKYPQYECFFIIIEDRINNTVLEKNKDDFLCQYIYHCLKDRYNCYLISNDKYRDRESYLQLFNFYIKVTLMQAGTVEKEVPLYLGEHLVKDICLDNIRCSIPKKYLCNILN